VVNGPAPSMVKPGAVRGGMIDLGHVELVRQTEKAICVALREGRKWLPKSQVRLANDGRLLVRGWLAAKNNL
jgi:hypothetical protein